MIPRIRMLRAVARTLLVACFLLVGVTGSAQVTGTHELSLQERYDGVVVNQTITVAGQDFYRHFVTAWRDSDMHDRYALAIRERPSARWGSQVWIEYAQRRIYQANLPTSRAAIRALGEQAAETAYQRIVETDVQRLLVRDADLGPDEFR